MADTTEKRLQDLERFLAHMPEDLDARFATIDVRLVAMREVLALYNTRFSRLEARLEALGATHDAQFGAILAALAEIRDRLPPR